MRMKAQRVLNKDSLALSAQIELNIFIDLFFELGRIAFL